MGCASLLSQTNLEILDPQGKDCRTALERAVRLPGFIVSPDSPDTCFPCSLLFRFLLYDSVTLSVCHKPVTSPIILSIPQFVFREAQRYARSSFLPIDYISTCSII